MSASAHPSSPALLAKLHALRQTLVDRAYELDRRGAPLASDLAMSTAAHLAELCDEFDAASSAPVPNPASRSLNNMKPSL